MRPLSHREVLALIRDAGRRGDITAAAVIYIENRVSLMETLTAYHEGRAATRFALHTEEDDE